MKRFKRSLSFVMTLFILSGVLPACSSPEEKPSASEQTQSDTIAVSKDYIVVFPMKDKAAGKLARSLSSKISDQYDLKLSVQNDYIIEGETVSNKEILVGKTNREESTEAYKSLGENEWSVSVVKDKIVIAGQSGIALGDAVQYFIENYMAGQKTLAVERTLSYKSTTEIYQLDWKNGLLIDTGISGGYPRLCALQNGSLMLAHDGMYVYLSSDGGKTWSKPRKASSDDRGTANAALYQTEDGTIYLGYRSNYYLSDGSFYSSIKVSYSTDNGYTWKKHSTVYENTETSGVYNGVWEPHFGMMNGKLTCFFANDSTAVTKMQNIEYLQWDEQQGKWTNRTIVSNGEAHGSRDGMPVWVALKDGGYACVMEAWSKDGKDGFVVQMTYSEDGKIWSDPIEVMRAKDNGTSCAAPYIVELPNGQLVVSCHTNELNGDASSDPLYMSTVISDGTPASMLKTENFSDHSYPYYDNQKPFGAYMWNGMYVYGSYIFAFSNGPSGIRINRLKFAE